jgi:hypothetical protein
VSEHIEQQVREVERHIEQASELGRKCVAALRDADDHTVHLIAERLPARGSMIVPDLLALIDAAQDERRAAAALVALDVGARAAAVSVLVDEIARRGGYAPLAAYRLAAHRIAEAAPAIHAALAATDAQDIDLATALLDALTRLGERPTEDEVRRMRRGPWQVQEALRRNAA